MPDEPKPPVNQPEPPPPPTKPEAGFSAQTKIASELEKMFPHGVIPEGRGSIKTAARTIGEPEDIAAREKSEAEAKAAKEKEEADAKEKSKQAAQPDPDAAAKAEADQKAANEAKAKADEAKVEADKKAAADATPPKADATAPTDAQLDAVESKMDLKAGTAFKHVRNELATTREELTKIRSDYESRLAAAEAKASTVNEAELATLKEKVAKYEGELAITHVESTEQYQTEIAIPLDTAMKQLAALAEKYEIPVAKLNSALSNEDANKRSDELSDLSANFNRLDTVRFDNLAIQLEQLGGKRQAILADAHKKLTEYQQKQEAESRQRAEAFKQSWSKALDTSRDLLTKELPIFRKTGDEKWDKELDEAVAKVRAVDIAKLPDLDLAKELYKASALPMVLKLIVALHGENNDQKEELAKYKQATPGAGEGTPPAGDEASKPKAPTTMIEALSSGLKGILPP